MFPDFQPLPRPPVCYVRIADKCVVSLSEGAQLIFPGQGIVPGTGHGPMKVVTMVIGRGIGNENCEAGGLVNHHF